MTVSLLVSGIVHRFALWGKKCWILQLLGPFCPVRGKEHGLVGSDLARILLIESWSWREVPWELHCGDEGLGINFLFTFPAKG